MMPLPFCQRRDIVEQFDRRAEVGQRELPADARALMRELPQGQKLHRGCGFMRCIVWHAPLAGHALPN